MALLHKNRSEEIIIAVDALAISRRSAGSFTVLLGLMRELPKLSSCKFIIYVLQRDIEQQLGTCNGRFEYVYAPRWAKRLVLRCFWQQLIMPRLAKKAGCRLLYSASGYPELFTLLPVVSHQQNLWCFAKPQRWWTIRNRMKSFLRRQIAKVAIHKSKANVFISDYIRECAGRMVPSTQGKNFTVHNGILYDLLSANTSVEKAASKRDLCISVGSLVVHKNYTTLLQAFKIVARKCANLDIVIVGNYKTDYGRKVRRLCRQLDLQNRVIFRGPLDFDSIIELYGRARFSINVSLLEGFGLPILESMAAGCPVISAASSALPEIGGDAVCYCDPQNLCDVAEKMIKMYQDEALRTKLRKLGLERAKQFIWENSALKLQNVLENAGKLRANEDSDKGYIL